MYFSSFFLGKEGGGIMLLYSPSLFSLLLLFVLLFPLMKILLPMKTNNNNRKGIALTEGKRSTCNVSMKS